MAAPAAVARQTPGGIILPDGFVSKFTFNDDPDICIEEVEITPGGLSPGELINLTSQHNTAWRTFFCRRLTTLKEFTIRGFYDPLIYTQLLARIQAGNQQFTIRFYDGSTLAFWGGVTDSTFGPLVEGTAPEITIVVGPTNRDASGDEQAPVLVEVSGT